jgi:hypothetical protein
MKTAYRIFVGMIALSLALAAGGVVHAQDGSVEKYFAQTGHWVSGDFWKYYQSFQEPELVFGYPITEAYQDLRTGLTIQYFQRARFEYHPEVAGQPVLLSPLGRLLYAPGNPALNLDNFFSCRAYAETGFPVCYAFLDFFDKYGGPAAFGYPISGFEIYDGRIVQYFERARFEWYPELPEGQKVVLGNLGRIFFDVLAEDPRLLAPAEGNAIVSDVIQLQAHVFTWKAVTASTDRQLVFVVVQDQTLRPVAGAAGTMTVIWPGGTSAPVAFATNEVGVAILELPVQDQPAGSQVVIAVTATYLGLTNGSQTSFRVWQ